jgi:hypothetical protein
MAPIIRMIFTMEGPSSAGSKYPEAKNLSASMMVRD